MSSILTQTWPIQRNTAGTWPVLIISFPLVWNERNHYWRHCIGQFHLYWSSFSICVSYNVDRFRYVFTTLLIGN